MRRHTKAGLFPALVIVLALAAAYPSFPAQVPSGKFRLAIVGLAHGHSFIAFRTLTKNTAVEVVGIADSNAALRELAAKDWPAVPMYEDYGRLLDEKKPEGVWSFVENDRHLEITRACVSRGIPLMFEKPMAMSAREAREMEALTRSRKIPLVINSQPPWWAENQAAFNLAKSGELGKVWRVHTLSGHGGPAPREPLTANRLAFWSFLNDEKRGGGATLDFGPYGAAWIRWFLGRPQAVCAVLNHTRPDVYRSNTGLTILASYPDNRVGIVEASWDFPRNFERLEVFGNLGSVQVFGSSGGIERMETYIGRDRKDSAVPPLPEDHRDPASYFASVVRSGRPVDEFVSAPFHVEVMEILDAALLSARTGRVVKLPARK